MEVGDEGAAVTQRVATALVLRSGEPFEQRARPRMPSRGVRLVDAVGLTALRYTNLFPPQHELADTTLQHERVYAVARRPNQHSGRSIKPIARRYLFTAGREHVLDTVAVAGLTPSDREDRPERAVDVGVRGAVKRIIQHRVGLARALRLEMSRLLDLFRDQRAYRPAPGKGIDEHVVGPRVEFLDLFALHVDCAAVTQ